MFLLEQNTDIYLIMQLILEFNVLAKEMLLSLWVISHKTWKSQYVGLGFTVNQILTIVL